MSSIKKEESTLVGASIADKAIPHIYANGYSFALGSGDIAFALLNEQTPVATLNLSYSAAKTISLKVLEAIATFEAASGQKINTMEENRALLSTRKRNDA